LKELSIAKKEILDGDLAREYEKEDLRLSFAKCAVDFQRWVHSKIDQIAVSRFGFWLQGVIEFASQLNERDKEITGECDKRQAEYQKILSEEEKFGVNDNQYTTETSETLSNTRSKLQDAIKKRQMNYKEVLKTEQDNDKLCKDFASLVTAYFVGIEKVKAQLSQDDSLEDQLTLIDSKITDEDSNLAPIKEFDDQMNKAMIVNNVHTTLTYLDAKLFFESFQKFLVVKKKNLEEELWRNKMNGISQEQYNEIDSEFKKYDKSGNGILEKNEFRACLFSLGDDRGSKEIKQIVQKYSTESSGMSYDGFKQFMVEQLGDSGTKMDMMYSFAMINEKINPNEKKPQTDSEKKELEEKLVEMEKIVSEDILVQVRMVEHDREYLKTHAPNVESGIDYGQWIDEVFAR